jgi:hypothetical protein
LPGWSGEFRVVGDRCALRSSCRRGSLLRVIVAGTVSVILTDKASQLEKAIAVRLPDPLATDVRCFETDPLTT